MSSDVVPTPSLSPTAAGLRVAVVSPGDRTDKLTTPLAAADVGVAVNPLRCTAYDVVICDTPDRAMLKTVVECRLTGTPVLFRMRGDPFYGIDEWVESRVKRQIIYTMLGMVDGCLAIAPHQAAAYHRHTSVPAEIVTLPKDPAAWPTTTHTDTELRPVTLTNAVYWEKVKPLLEIAPLVDEVLDTGTWRIGSWSEGYSDKIREALAPYENIEYGVGLDAGRELDRANIMLHHSRLDVLPNAVLEGMASELPVLTNDHVAFTDSDAPLTITRTDDELRAALSRYRDPERRQRAGETGRRYVAHHHAPERVGVALVDAMQRLVPGVAP